MPRKSVDDWTSIPLLNDLTEADMMLFQMEFFAFGLFRAQEGFHHDDVGFHKARLGKQDYCFTGNRRSWVWDRRDLGFRVFVRNLRGISVEMDPEMVAEEVPMGWGAQKAKERNEGKFTAFQIWRNYLEVLEIAPSELVEAQERWSADEQPAEQLP